MGARYCPTCCRYPTLLPGSHWERSSTSKKSSPYPQDRKVFSVLSKWGPWGYSCCWLDPASSWLSEELEERSTLACGTVRSNRVDLPREIYSCWFNQWFNPGKQSIHWEGGWSCPERSGGKSCHVVDGTFSGPRILSFHRQLLHFCWFIWGARREVHPWLWDCKVLQSRPSKKNLLLLNQPVVMSWEAEYTLARRPDLSRKIWGKELSCLWWDLFWTKDYVFSWTIIILLLIYLRS